jgi:hypothetical protein
MRNLFNKILCLIGIHDWIWEQVHYKPHMKQGMRRDVKGTFYHKRCVRCDFLKKLYLKSPYPYRKRR